MLALSVGGALLGPTSTYWWLPYTDAHSSGVEGGAHYHPILCYGSANGTGPVNHACCTCSLNSTYSKCVSVAGCKQVGVPFYLCLYL